MINIPELSWRPFDHPSDVISVGQEVTAEVLGVDMTRERVSLSLRAVQGDPWRTVGRGTDDERNPAPPPRSSPTEACE
ncbi:S1 RNA-binding domain-containing protein [Streptomyces globisporus]